MEYYSLPILTKAIQFTGDNYGEVNQIVSLNKGHSELCYLDKEGNPTKSGMITEHRALQLMAGPGAWIVAPKGSWIILNNESGMFPVPDADFKRYYVSSTDEISDGVKTFGEYKKELQQFWPTPEHLETAATFKIDEDASFDLIEFIKENACITTLADGRVFYVVNGNTFIF